MSDECDCTTCSADDLLIPQLPPMQEQCTPERPCAWCNWTSVNVHLVQAPPLVPAANCVQCGSLPGETCPNPGGVPCGRPAARRTVIGFTGLAGSGKSECSRRLIEHHGFVRGKFAGALKEMMRALLRYRGASPELIERMVEGDLKEAPSPLLNGRTPRHAMQTLGTEWGRDCIDLNLWVDTEMDARAASSCVVFDDVRFPNEAEAIKRAGGIIVRVERHGAGAGAAGHSSEGQALPIDITITNNRSIGHLREHVDDLVRDLSWALAE